MRHHRLSTAIQLPIKSITATPSTICLKSIRTEPVLEDQAVLHAISSNDIINFHNSDTGKLTLSIGNISGGKVFFKK